ncbi:MAG TPA: putative Ig domain-containing protein [Candidatus Krumholzibacteria bacterium]|nr:putative Ig domain-containing protein [Candidatus Krumholzibacteria bacterium]
MKRVGWILVLAFFGFVAYGLRGRAHETAATPQAAPVAPGTWVVMPQDAQSMSTLEVHCVDAGVEPEVKSCKWFRNGTEVEGETGTSLAPGRFARDDVITAEVVPQDQSAPVRTAPVRIKNSAPRITAASADLRSDPSAMIFVQVSAVDADHDNIALSYQWYRNGRPMSDETGPSVNVRNFQMGDEVYASVTASDGKDSSAPEKSDPIKIGSNAPDITSTPPSTLEAGRRFVYQVQVHAPKPKEVKYQLVDAPEGMTIDESGLIEWTMPALDTNSHTYEVAIKVSDPTGGEAVQRFQLSTSALQPANTPANSSVQRSSNQ